MQKKENLISFFVLLSIGMFLSVLLKNENPWDLANYHYYNVFAFLNDRSNLDVVPASVNTFFNPIMDLPLYFYIQYFNDYPNILYALQGIWGGLFLFMLYKICLLFFTENNKYALFSLVLILTVSAQATFCQIGASTNEIPVSFFILWGLYILLKMIKLPQTQTLKKFLIAGLIMGMGLGLKQTVITYCVASGLTLMICYKYLNKPIKSIFVFALSGFIGYLVINGYFMYKYWVLYGNPFFPFLNGVFHSPYFFDFNYRDTNFIPTLAEFFIFPFMWNIDPLKISDLVYYDLRLTIYYLIPLVVFLFLSFYKKLKNFYLEQKPLTMLYVFVFLSILIWMAIFSIMRYIVVIEAIGAVILVNFFQYYNKSKHKYLFATHILLIAGLTLSVFLYPNWGHFYGKHIELQEIVLPKNTLVKIYGMPTAFVIPQLAKKNFVKTVSYYPKCTDTKIQCINGKGADFAEYGLFLEKRNKIEKEHLGPVIYIYNEKHFNVFKTKEQLKEDYQTKLKLCQRAVSLGWIKNIKKCISEHLKQYLYDMEIAENYILDEDVALNYDCEKLKNNLFQKLRICVPKELKTQILGKGNE